MGIRQIAIRGTSHKAIRVGLGPRHRNNVDNGLLPVTTSLVSLYSDSVWPRSCTLPLSSKTVTAACKSVYHGLVWTGMVWYGLAWSEMVYHGLQAWSGMVLISSQKKICCPVMEYHVDSLSLEFV